MQERNHYQDKIRFGLTLFISVVSIGLLLNGCGSKPKVYRIGILSGSEAFIKIADGFKEKMTELGYIEGQNIIYDLQALNADPEGGKRIAKKFVADKVDLILAFPTEPAIAAKEAVKGTAIPVVFVCGTIEGNNLVESISRPGGNITGVRYPGPDLTVKRFEILRMLAPQVKRLYITYDPNYPAIPPSLEMLRKSTASLGIALVEDPINNVKELQAVLEKRAGLKDMGMDAILIMPEVLTQSPDGWALISQFAKEHRIPIAGSAGFEADSGAVFSYIPDNVEQGKLAAPLADNILKGIPAGNIFVITPNPRLRLNYKLARELGLKVGESIMSLADEIQR